MLNNAIAVFAAPVPPVTNSYESISTVTLGSSASSITFSSIPSTYKHLQIRYIARTDMNSGGAWSPINVRFNSDTGSNYSIHSLGGTGSAAFAEGYPSQTSTTGGFGTSNTVTANTFSAGVIDILDYGNTSKNKTLRVLNGLDTNGSGIVLLQSGGWFSTSAISTITLGLYGGSNGSNYLQYSSFALYGIKG